MAANNSHLITVCSLLLLFVLPSMAVQPKYHHAPTTPQKKSDVVVEGVVYCQSCKYAGSWSLTGAKTIPSARVSVTCKNSRHQVSFYKAYQADKHGYFYAQLDGFKLSHGVLDHPLQACTVKLLSSPLATCNVRTNLNYGIDGAKLRSEGKVLRSPHYEAVIYAAGPLAFRPETCSNHHG
ncbi:unnamed protein product [Linum tenue]|uniref:Non-classical arabinogalactan protein 30 n=2 Tax=Linum tenue TaxID=586396 RepID=A0AAV0K495_9ROSI|nr:unnamed protein product [Linum tenue]